MTKITNSKKFLAVFLSILFLFSAFAPAASALVVDEGLLVDGFRVTSEKNYRLISGVQEKHFTINNKSNSNQINNYALEIDLSNPDISIVAGYNDGDTDGWGRATVLNQASALESKRGVNVIAGINGDFFNKETGEPTGILIMDSVVGKQANWEPFFGITKDGKAVIRGGYSSYADIKEAISGSAIIVKNGQAINLGDTTLAPRTAVGIKADGSVIFFVCDGRQAPESCGMTITDVGKIMLALGCVDAINLDGGGSSTFVTKREANSTLSTKNKPCYKVDRPVSTSLLVCSTAQPTGVFDHVAFSSEEYECALTSYVPVKAYAVDTNGFQVASASGGKIVVEDSSYGYIIGNYFYAKNKSGSVNVNYVIDGEVVGTAVVKVSSDADTALDRTLKNIFQQFLDLFQLVRFTLEKLKTSGGQVPRF